MATEKQLEKKDETRQRILKAGAQAFAEKGFAGARVDEIAQQAGVNKASIYYHIGDKEALYAEVIHAVFGDLADRMAEGIENAGNPRDKLCAYIDTFAEGLDRHAYLPAIMMREMASGGGSFPLLAAEDMRKIMVMLAAILEEGIQSGIFVQTIPFAVHSMLVGGLVFYRASYPIRSRFGALHSEIAALPENASEIMAEEFKNHILHMISK
jgi:TetR/AcrR family transcriptional regulator